MEARLQVFSGSSNPALAAEITEYLGVHSGRALVGTYEDGETRIRLEEHVRGSDVFVVQSLYAPVDHHIMELLLMVDAVRRCSAARVTVVIPYMAYAKQEKKSQGAREPISAKLLANILATAGADRFLAVDLHSAAIEGFFDIPVDHLRSTPMLADYFDKLYLPDLVVASPDTGGVARANEIRERLGASLAIIYRQGPNHKNSGALEMVGDVAGKQVLIMDDMISTGHTLLSAADALKERGAAEIYACATHGVFAGSALDAIAASVIKRLVVTNTVPLPSGSNIDKLEVLSVGPLIAEAILRIHKDISLSSLFM